jgi:predicted metal-binding transcription factor (methanogenesis marker protein 9)
METITISPDNCLYLTHDERVRFAKQLRQALVCRTTTEFNDPVVVADITLTPVEARRLVEELQDVLMEAHVDWLHVGF